MSVFENWAFVNLLKITRTFEHPVCSSRFQMTASLAHLCPSCEDAVPTARMLVGGRGRRSIRLLHRGPAAPASDPAPSARSLRPLCLLPALSVPRHRHSARRRDRRQFRESRSAQTAPMSGVNRPTIHMAARHIHLTCSTCTFRTGLIR